MRSLTYASAGCAIEPTLATYPSLHLSHPLTLYSSIHQLSTLTHDPQPKPVPHIQHPFFAVTNNSLALSAQARDHVSQAIQDGWANSTIDRYSGAIKEFIQFCDAERVPEHMRFPTDEYVLCAFAASSLSKHSGSTPCARISALKAWHAAHNVDWKGSIRLRYVLKGVSNAAPRSSTRSPRLPIKAKMLTQLVKTLDLNSPIDAAVAACAATAFWGQCRLGELLPLSSTSPDCAALPSRSDFKRSIRNPQSCVLHLPSTKTHRHGQDIVLVDQCFPINPISLLKNHIRINNVTNTDFIFSYSMADGHFSLSKAHFLRRCNVVWHSLGYPHTTGHCFRIGGTTELLIGGTPPDVVKATGRWSSGSFMRYWRSLDAIAPQHIRNLHTFKHRCRRTRRQP